MVEGAGGIINDNKAIICGGFNYDNRETTADCFSLGPEKMWTQTESLLKTPRYDMSTGNIIINNRLWISGGLDESGRELSTTELVNEDQSLKSEDLPVDVYGHCSVLLNRTRIMTIGGWSGWNRRETNILDLTTNNWTPGPKLNKGRTSHGCAKMTIGDKDLVVVTGGDVTEKSVEYLDLTDMDQGWKRGNFFILNCFFLADLGINLIPLTINLMIDH